MNLEQEKREVKQWLLDSSNKERLWTKPFDEIKKSIAAPIQIKRCAEIAFNLSLMKIWTSNVLINQLSDEATPHDAKETLTLFVDLFYSSIRIFTKVIDDPNGSSRIFALDLQNLFFVLGASGRYEQASWLGGRVYAGDTLGRFSGKSDQVYTLQEIGEWESLGGDDVGWRGVVSKLRRLIPSQREKECSAGRLDDDPMFPYWEEKPLCGYMLRLWLVMTEQIDPEATPEGLPGCGVYDGLFTNWNRPDALTESLNEACDYHVRRSTEDGDGDYDVPEFSMRPYNLIPFEILAFRNVRTKMGLENRMPDHPLLQTPFVKNLPQELPPSNDPLLLEALAAVRRVLPDV
jgi:hypothetical protein